MAWPIEFRYSLDLYERQVMSQKFIQALLEAKAMQLKVDPPFTYASGLKGPVYCDNRVLYSELAHRQIVAQELALVLPDSLRELPVVGVATSGIVPALLLAEAIESSFAYVRPSPKEHGLGRQLEGRLAKGSQVILVEDLINQGKSLGQALKALEDEEISVRAVLCLVDYEFPLARQELADKNIPLFSLGKLSEVLIRALESNIIKESDYHIIKQWQLNPNKWDSK